MVFCAFHEQVYCSVSVEGCQVPVVGGWCSASLYVAEYYGSAVNVVSVRELFCEHVSDTAKANRVRALPLVSSLPC